MFKKYLLLLFVSIMQFAAFSHTKTSLNNGWSFILGDDSTYKNEDYDHSSWRVLNVPHDWAFELGYAEDNDSRAKCGYAKGGVGWYRKELNLTAAECQNRLFINFDAVYMNSEVWINGYYLGKRPYGYISFEYEISPYVKQGKNTIAVRVDNSLGLSARWYHGCGIYGNVNLLEYPSTRFKDGGIYVTTPNVTENSADVAVEWELDSKNKNGNLSVGFEIIDQMGSTVSKSQKIKVEKMDGKTSIEVKNPKLWDEYKPNLYTLVSSIYEGSKLIEKTSTTFGIRTIKWEIKTGFWLNGRNVKLRGMCEHLEGGPVGAMWSENLMRWKVEKLKSMGCNAIRTAHNPQLPMFYDICNELGMMVLDEAYDGWFRKADYDYGMQAFEDWGERDLKDFIRRDRNHPSVVLWSVGNETNVIGDSTIAQKLVSVCKENDPTRLVTSSMSNIEVMDVFGGNGMSENKWFMDSYETTDKPFIGTEYPHGGSTRGYFRTQTLYTRGYPSTRVDPIETPNLTDKEIFEYEWANIDEPGVVQETLGSEYDNVIVRLNNRQAIEYLRDKAWFSGMFKWIGFDYYGESREGDWPFRGSRSGVYDWAGFEKATYYIYKGEWSDEPMVYIMPHWTHPYMKLGTEIPVWVLTTGDEVELFFNGKSLGREKKGKKWNEMQCDWMVPYEPGTLEAVAYKDGKEIMRTSQTTSKEPSELSLYKEESYLTGDLSDLHVFTVDEIDSNGTLYPYGENRVHYHVEGDCEIVSAENGSNHDTDINFNAVSRRCQFGRQRVIVRKNSQNDAKLYVGTILADKRLKISPKVSIDIRSIEIGGEKMDVDCQIFYTVDGSKPTRSSQRYSKSFAVKPETTVKAIVVINGEVVMDMEEKFGANEGIYWGKPVVRNLNKTVMQVEKCKLENIELFKIENRNTVLNGRMVALPTEKNAVCRFYEENDGEDVKLPLDIYFTYDTIDPITFKVYNNGVFQGEVTPKMGEDKIGKMLKESVEFNFRNGANQIKVEIISNKNVLVDWFEVGQ